MPVCLFVFLATPPAVAILFGPFIYALRTGMVNPNKVAFGYFQTRGGCMATNYVAMFQKGLIDAGFPQVRTIPHAPMFSEARLVCS